MREFVAKHPTTDQFILIIKGREGFHKYPCTPERADLINDLNGNSESDLQVAITGSMFGWDTPAARALA